MYKAKFYQKALKAMKKYRDEAGGKQIVSVHRRWFIENGKTQCEVRMKKCPQFCSKCGDREYKSKNVGTFKYTCHYTEENVRKKFKDEIDKDAFIILFTDGQSKEYDAYDHNDNNHSAMWFYFDPISMYLRLYQHCLQDYQYVYHSLTS